jgi:ABC-2 type transport system permease protein
VTSLLYVVNTLAFFVSGQMFPLDLLDSFSPALVSVLKALPFQYMAYFPAAIFVGKIQGVQLVNGLVMEVVWALLFIILTRWLYRLGLRHYSAFGG